MKKMKSSYLIKISTLIKQNVAAIFIFIIWFSANYIVFLSLSADFVDAFLILFYFKEHQSLYGNFYSNFSEFIIFGIIFSLITVELYRKYNPLETCRKLARKYDDHAIIIGYNHIGQRIYNHLTFIGKEAVVIDKNKEAVKELIDEEKAVVVDDALKMKTLIDAGIRRAKAVFVMSDDLELELVVNDHIRYFNKTCKLVCRIFEDDIAEVIANTYDAKTISTSKYASDVIINRIQEKGYENILLIGMNHISARIIKRIKKKFPERSCHLIEEDEEIIEDLIYDQTDNIIIGDPKELEVLAKVNIEKIDLVVNVISNATHSVLITKRIRDLNLKCKIISRFFQDTIAEIVEKSPFNSEVMSYSKHTLEIMIENGLLNY
ncbi:MAG: hypothetical protein BAJALOKI2v1_10031 [Promethearchaeota archaeon]|nr:MAG: hypothetical protein BAJALOKI2v1_10031 [Candidatus Lokiarchaeota archaeon]